MAKTESVEVQMHKILDEFDDHIQDVTNAAIDRVSQQSATELRNTSPKRTGAYARGWTKKKFMKRGINTVVVHNKEYQLTHLLENGHIVRNKYGTYGRAPAIKHIKPVEEWAQSELPAEIERNL